MEEITEKDGVEDKVNISETMQLSWRKGSKQGVQRLSVKSSEGNSEKKKKIRNRILKERTTDAIQLANRRSNGLKETGSFGGECGKWSK